LTPEDVTGMFLLLGAGFGIAAFVLLIETIAWIITKIKRKFILEKKADQDSAVLHKPGDMRHESTNNEQHEMLVYDYRDQPRFRKRHAYSAGARFKTCEDFDEKSEDRLQYFISMTSLPVTSSPKLKNRRMQTPKPKHTFTVGEADMSGDDIPKDTSYNGHRKYEGISRVSEFQTGNTDDKYFGAKFQEQSYHTFGKDDTSSSPSFRENRDK
jgi:hypothetical protein